MRPLTDARMPERNVARRREVGLRGPVTTNWTPSPTHCLVRRRPPSQRPRMCRPAIKPEDMVPAGDGRDHMESVTEYIDNYCKRGFEGQLLPLIPGDKSPVRGVRCKEPLPCVMADYGRTKMTSERLRGYYRAEPRCNLGLLTGIRSGIVVVDIDRPKSEDPDIVRRFEEVILQVRDGALVPGIGPADTTCYETARGTHVLFKRSAPLRSISGVVLEELGLAVDVKGEGGMVVVPPSITGNRRREFLRDLDCLKELPIDAEVVRRTRRDERACAPFMDRRMTRPLPKFNVRPYLCAKALTERDIPNHERDNTLFVLYNVLLRAGNPPESAQEVVRRVNDGLSNPMTTEDLQKCVRRRYDYGCVGIRQMLPDIVGVCASCKMNQRAGRRLTDMIDPLDLERIGRARTVPKTALVAYLLDRSGQARTRREMAESLGVSERAIYAGLKRLHEEAGVEVPSRT